MSSPVVIASILREQGDTGVQTHVRAVREAFLRDGRSVQVVTPFRAPRWQVYPVFGARRLIDRLHKPASVWWYRHWHAVFLYRALRRVLADGAKCVIYAQCPVSADAALRARATKRQKVVMVVHFNLSQAEEWADKGGIRQGGAYFRAMQAFEATTLVQVDALLYVSDFMRRALERRIPALTNVPCTVVPNFVDDPGEPVVIEPQADLITVGTLERRKNQRFALQIIHAAKRLGHELTLTVVGDGPDRVMLQGLSRDLGIDTQVRFMGFVADAAQQMTRHRACLHVAQLENMPLTLIEAMSRGMPVFAPAVGGIPEIFTDGEEGRFISLDDAAAAALLIIQILENRRLVIAMRAASRRRFLSCFETNLVAQILADFLDGNLGKDK